jgi:hypothetical protein
VVPSTPPLFCVSETSPWRAIAFALLILDPLHELLCGFGMEDEVDRHIAASAARLSAIVTPNAKLVVWSVEPETYFGLLPDGLLCQIHEHLGFLAIDSIDLFV